jgi:hypothetical protein
MALFRTPELPEDLLPESLQDQPAPIAIMAAQPDTLQTPADIWSALDNELRPAVPCVVTMALNPYRPITGPLVRTRELRIGPALAPAWQQQLFAQVKPDTFWTIGGTIRCDQPLENLRLTLVERGVEVPLQPEGRFTIGNLEVGDYTLEVSAKGRKTRRHKITVPAPDYDLEL